MYSIIQTPLNIRKPLSAEMSQSYDYTDFRLPYTSMPSYSKRLHILHELKKCLTIICPASNEMAPYSRKQQEAFLKKNSWPQGRMYYVQKFLEDSHIYETPSKVAIDILHNHLLGKMLPVYLNSLPFQDIQDLCTIVVGFLTVDILPQGYTISTLWNQANPIPLPLSIDDSIDNIMDLVLHYRYLLVILILVFILIFYTISMYS